MGKHWAEIKLLLRGKRVSLPQIHIETDVVILAGGTMTVQYSL